MNKPDWMQFRWWAWLCATNQTNEQAKSKTGCNAYFMSWINEQWQLFGKPMRAPINTQDHKDFDEWLYKKYVNKEV